MGWRETGIAMLILAGCTNQNTSPPSDNLEERVDFYQSGKELKKRAENETDLTKRKELYLLASADFMLARRYQQNAYDALLEEADCESYAGNFKRAFELCQTATQTQKTSKAYSLQGQIVMRHELYEIAEDSFTNAIQIEDNPIHRWNRYDARRHLAITNRGILEPWLDKSLEDAKKYTELIPEEPDGYLAQYVIYGLKAAAYKDSKDGLKYLRLAYYSLENAFNRIKKGKKTELFVDIPIKKLEAVYEILRKRPELQSKTF